LENKEKDIDIEYDKDFVTRSSQAFACLNYYANTIEDIHLYFLDTNEFLRFLSVATNRQSFPTDTSTVMTRLFDKVYNQDQGLLHKIRDALVTYGYPKPENLEEIDPRTKDPAGQKACWTDPEQSTLSYPVPALATPYPALLTAYSLAAVESPETGILYLRNWIHRASKAGNVGGSPYKVFRRQWYLLRAKIEYALIATSTSIQSRLQSNALIEFEREITDEYASLNHAKSAASWSELCAQSVPRDVHSGLARYLAFNYATARNYLFELQTPGLFQTWRDLGQDDMIQYLGEDLTEATMLAEKLEAGCFSGVAAFDDARYRRGWIGQFRLNVAQLQIDRLPSLPASEQEKERAKISWLLDAADSELRATSSSSNEELIDRLLSPPPFENQRQRVASLRSLLNKSKN
jgi:hypothetical protein